MAAPFGSTVTTLVFDEVYVSFDECDTSRTVPSENDAKTVSDVVCPTRSKYSPDSGDVKPLGRSGLSTWMVTGGD